jgi:predicted HTH transcriptional regulator
MIQPGLFDAVEPFPNREPLAASVDPATSHIAAHEITRTGLRGRQKKQVLEAVKRFPDRTSAELALTLNLDRYAVARRLPDLMHDGLVEQGPARNCSVTGHKAVTWKVINA